MACSAVQTSKAGAEYEQATTFTRPIYSLQDKHKNHRCESSRIQIDTFYPGVLPLGSYVVTIKCGLGCDAIPDGDHEDGAAAILVGQDAPDGGGQQHAQEYHRRQRRLLVFWMDGTGISDLETVSAMSNQLFVHR